MLQPTSSIGQGLLGLGLTGLNIYGRGLGASGGPWTIGNFSRSIAGKKYGGRVVQRQEGGEVPNIYSQGQQVAASPAIKGGLGGFFGGMFPRSRQTNVIENIDNAAGSLNSYKEAMDQKMKDLRRASQGIAQTYGQTFGQMQANTAPYVQNVLDQRRSLMEISDPIRHWQQPKPQPSDFLEMKAGGGLGSLPVVKRQMGGPPITRPNYQYPQTDTIPQEEPTNNADRMKQLLEALKAQQGKSGYGVPTDDLLSGELAKRQADRRKKAREEIIKGMKEAMPKSQRLSGLLVAAKRVMGADPSKGFINAVVEGMAGLDEAQQEDYLRQKEQELKILELEGKGKMDDLTATEAAETQAAKFPIKIAEIEAKKIGNKFKLSKAQLEVAKVILSNLDQIISDPSSFNEIVKFAFASIPGAENFGKEVLAAIEEKVFKMAGKQGKQSDIAVRRRRNRVGSRAATVDQIPTIKKQ